MNGLASSHSRRGNLLLVGAIVLFCVAVGLEAAARNPSGAHQLIQRVCTNETFKCPEGRCIPKAWKCDLDMDCENGEDEQGCDGSCTEGEHRCGIITSGGELPGGKKLEPQLSPNCIPHRWVCDGEIDCQDRSDERDCPQVNCNENQFECKEFDGQFKLCIPNSWVCDGQRDCASGEDEANCKEHRKCATNEFQCSDGQCIFASWKCDHENDCDDGSDETKGAPANCDYNTDEYCTDPSMFKCEKNGCIPKGWRCDGEPDCMDHSDEKNCTEVKNTCKPEEYPCKTSTHCINMLWKCDGEEDCPDGSDESDPTCQEDNTCTSSDSRACPAPPGGKKKCFPQTAWCNGIEDCPDGSDEKDCGNATYSKTCDNTLEYTCSGTPLQCVAYKDLCKDKQQTCGVDETCSVAESLQFCTKGSDGCMCRDTFVRNVSICHCKEGYKLNKDAKQCVDIDECQEPGACDQICFNKPGTYTCDCRPGYKLSLASSGGIPRHCRAVGGDPLVLLSNRATIRQFDLVTNVHLPLISSPGSAVAMDFHLSNGTLIWSDITMKAIMSCSIGNDSDNHHLVSSTKCAKDLSVLLNDSIHTPDGLAIDWIHDLLFWTDGGLDQVNVLDLKTNRRRVLFQDKLEEPRAIAVDPELGLIFWTDWGKEARIERAGMDGQNRTVIVKGDRVKWPNGLALDYVEKRVYWADAKIKSIFSCDYWGEDIKTVLHSHQYLRHPFSMAVFEDRIYYTDWEHDGVITVNKFTGSDVRKVMQKVSSPMTVRIYHRQAQPDMANKCASASCKQICLPRAHLRAETKQLERALIGHPYACACESTTPLDVIECAAELTAGGSGFSLFSMFLLLLAIMSVIGGVFFYRRRRAAGGAFMALNFENPIYRRTTEAEMENPFRDPLDDGPMVHSSGSQAAPSRLVLSDMERDIQNGHTIA